MIYAEYVTNNDGNTKNLRLRDSANLKSKFKNDESKSQTVNLN